MNRVNVNVTAAIGHKKGIFLECEPECKRDFWVFLGSLAGWGRFSLVTNRLPLGPNNTFELVEIRPANEEAPNPVVIFGSVLWRKKEALEDVARNAKMDKGFLEFMTAQARKIPVHR